MRLCIYMGEILGLGYDIAFARGITSLLYLEGRAVHPQQLVNQWNLHPAQAEIVQHMAQSRDTYAYNRADELRFELMARGTIMDAAKAMSYSGARFTDFENSYCNPAYWELQPNGGFMLKQGVSPAAAIKDIFHNGHAYGFECAVAMIIVYYRAMIEILGERVFNQLFDNLYLWSWHQDTDLGLVTRNYSSFIPGDVVYFNNPDVHPAHIESQGLNAVLLENELYFGHGMGIQPAREIIRKLNALRKPFSFRSAYLMRQATRPNFRYLMNYAGMRKEEIRALAVICKVGGNTHLL